LEVVEMQLIIVLPSYLIYLPPTKV